MATNQQADLSTLISAESLRQTAQLAVEKSFDRDLLNVALKKELGVPNVKISTVSKPVLSITGDLSTGLTCQLSDFTLTIRHNKALGTMERMYERTISGSMDVLVKTVCSPSADASHVVYDASVTSVNWKCSNTLISSHGATPAAGCRSFEALMPDYSADPFVCSSSTYAAKHGVQVRRGKSERVCTSNDDERIVLGGKNQTVLCTGSNVTVFTDGENSQISTTGTGSRIICCGINGSVSTVGNNSVVEECGRNYRIKAFGHNARIVALGSNSRISSSSNGADLCFYGAYSDINANGRDIRDDLGQLFVGVVGKAFRDIFN